MQTNLWLLLLLVLQLTTWPLMGQAESAGANLPAQPIGPTDLVAISVYGAPELTRTVRVGEDGLIRLPMLRERIDARGLLPAELEGRIAATLVGEGILVDPAVTVTIAEYHSRPISVAGAVKSPVTFQAVGKTTLLEAVTRAQGLTEDAGAEILVTRAAKGGQPGLTERIPRLKLIDAADPVWNVLLEGGEEVRVPQAGRIFVVGNVKKPGTFRVEENGRTTLLKALAMAEGLAPYANKMAYVYRPVDGAARSEIVVELGKILNRKGEDVVLAPNDILYVPDNRSRRVTTSAIEKAIAFATGTLSGILILGMNR
jgi:polysaccharide biosynthesis/export protein